MAGMTLKLKLALIGLIGVTVGLKIVLIKGFKGRIKGNFTQG